jgi:hypothetical protein
MSTVVQPDGAELHAVHAIEFIEATVERFVALPRAHRPAGLQIARDALAALVVSPVPAADLVAFLTGGAQC